MALTGPEFLKKWTSAAGAGLLAAGLSLSPLSGAYGQSATDVAHTQNVCSRDASKETINIQAGQHSMCSRDVSVIVYGNADNASGAQIGAFIQKEFQNRGIPAKVFLGDTDKQNGVALRFWLKGLSYGPFSGNNWQDGFAEVQHHYPSAWATLSPRNDQG